MFLDEPTTAKMLTVRTLAALGLALGLAAALLVLDGLGWRIMSATFDRERLITGTR